MVSGFYCRGQEGSALLFDKFGWKSDLQENWIKRAKIESPSSSEFLAEWEKTLNFDYYKASVRERFAKMVGEARFKWVIYIDEYYRGDFGEFIAGRFAGRTTDDRLVLLSKQFRGDTHGALLTAAEWQRIDVLKNLDEYANFDWKDVINLRSDDDLPEKHDEGLAIYCWVNGKAKAALAASLNGGEVPDSLLPSQISAVKGLRSALKFVNPEVSIPIRLRTP